MRDLEHFRDYQLAALDFCRRTPRGYLAAKAGAGKTAIALAYASELLFDSFDIERVLVIAPKRVVPQWAEEARKWAFGALLTFSEYVGHRGERERALATPSSVMVVSFEHFYSLLCDFRGRPWPFGLVIFDEASRLRNGGRLGSAAWKMMNAVSKKTSARILLLSGSPRPGTAHELFAPVFLLDQGQRLGRTLTGFRQQYLEPNKSNPRTGQVYSWQLRPGMEQTLYDTIADLFFAVAPDLGLSSVTIDRWVDLPPDVAAACEELRREGVLDLDELEVTAPSAGVIAGKLHQMCQGLVYHDTGDYVQHVHDEKIEELRELLEDVKEPVIVCYWYRHELEQLKWLFPQAVDIATAKGLAAAKAGKVQLALLHPGSAGHGIDGLQDHFNVLVWFAVPASFELYDQACRRLVRSGQQSTVRIYRIVARNGIVDERILERLGEKERGQDTFFKHLEASAI